MQKSGTYINPGPNNHHKLTVFYTFIIGKGEGGRVNDWPWAVLGWVESNQTQCQYDQKWLNFHTDL